MKTHSGHVTERNYIRQPFCREQHAIVMWKSQTACLSL
jgi:hypothetical protein